jgi:WD40 repeat protein
LADDLERFLKDEPIRAKRATLWMQVKRWARRHKPIVVSAGVSLLMLLVMTVIGLVASNALILRERDQTRANLGRAERAEREKTKNLWDAYVGQARAIRLSPSAGRRFDGLAALDRARALLPALEPDEQRLLTLRNETIACLVLPDLGIAREWEGHPPGTTAVAFDATLELYARSDEQGNIRVRRVADDAELKHLPDPGKLIVALAFSPDGHFLAAHHWGETPAAYELSCWDWRGGEKVLALPFSGCDFSPDGRWLAVNGKDGGAIQAYDLSSPTKASKTLVKDAASGGIVFHPDGRKLALATGQSIRVWDLETGRGVAYLSAPDGQAAMPRWSKNGLFLAIASGQDIHVLGGTSYQRLAVLKGHDNTVVQLAFSHGGDLLASVAWDATVRLWDVPGGRELVRARHPVGMDIRFSPDDRRLAGGRDGTRLCLWEVAAGRECRRLEGSNRLISLTPDGRLFVHRDDNGVYFGEWPTGKAIGSLPVRLKGHLFLNEHTLLTTDGNRLYRWPIEHHTGEGAHRLRIGPPRPLWQKYSNFSFPLPWPPPVVTARQPNGHVAFLDVEEAKAPVLHRIDHPSWASLCFSPDGKWFATGTRVGTGVKVWDAQSGALVTDLPVSGAASAQFTPDGRWLVTGAASEYRFWEAGSWQPGRRIPTSFQNLTFTRDGALMAIRHSPAVVHLIDPASGRLLAALEAPDRSLIEGFSFSPDGSHLVGTNLVHSGHVWDLRLIRQQLAAKGLDWDLPPYPPPRAEDRKPIRIEYDLGELTPGRQHRLDLEDHRRLVAKSPEDAMVANNLAWLLVTGPDPAVPDALEAVELARKAIKQDPQNGTYWNTLAVAHYRSGDLRASLEAFDKSLELRLGGDALDWFFLAMIHARQNHKGQARFWYDRAVQWLEANKPQDEELRRFREEAAALLGVREGTATR